MGGLIYVATSGPSGLLNKRPLIIHLQYYMCSIYGIKQQYTRIS